MPNPFDPDYYDANDPFSPSARSMAYAAAVQALADEAEAAEDDSPFDNPPDYLSFNGELGRLLYPYTDPDSGDPEDVTTGEIGDRLRGLRLDDLDATPVGKVYLRNIKQVLEARNDDDDAYTDWRAKIAYVTSSVKSNLVEPYSGDIVEIGGAGKRVKLPLVTTESGIGNQEKYLYSPRNEERIWLGDRPQTLLGATLLAEYGDTANRDSSRDITQNTTTALCISMRFKPLYTDSIGCIKVQPWVTALAGGGGFKIQVFADNGSGKPDTATLLGTSATIDASVLGATAGGLVTCNFPTPIAVIAGTMYHLIPLKTAATPFTMSIGTDASSPGYTDGTLLLYAGGGVWNEQTEDAIFEVWGAIAGGASGGGGAGPSDASAVTYAPAVLTDWDGDADPGNVDDALDQLAERTDDIEGDYATGTEFDDHNARHEPGGGDPMAVDAAAATGSLRTIGTGALTACAGNDARLSDARTPSAHGPSKHTEGTAWRLIYLNADGDETEIVLGADGTFLESNGAAAAPAFRALAMGDIPTAAKQVCISFVDTDAGTASTSVPKYTLIIPFACTITDVEIILGANQACGATSIIADIHKIAAADRDTGGTGTTLYTTQGNRPTVANTHRYALATDPDVTAVAAGDALLLFIDQAGTGVTNCTVTITATKT